jgi:hypothetical protein
MAWGSARTVSHEGLRFDGGIPYLTATTFVKNQDEKKPVKISTNKTMALCAANDDFDGFVLSVGVGVSTIQDKGFITVPYSGSDPTAGNRPLLADGAGKIKLGTSAVAAQGTITLADVPTANDTITIGFETYTWKAARAAAFDVAIGANVDACLANLETAINTDSSLVTAANDAPNDKVVVTAKAVGIGGNGIALAENGSNTSVDAAYLGKTRAGVSAAGNIYKITDVDTTAKTITINLG